MLEVRLQKNYALRVFEGKRGIEMERRSSEQGVWGREALWPAGTGHWRPVHMGTNLCPPRGRCQQLPGRGRVRGPLRVWLPARDGQRLQRPLQRERGSEHRPVRALRPLQFRHVLWPGHRRRGLLHQQLPQVLGAPTQARPSTSQARSPQARPAWPGPAHPWAKPARGFFSGTLQSPPHS